MLTAKRYCRGLIVLLAMTSAACMGKDSIAPQETASFDAARTNSDLAALRSAIDQPAWISLTALAARFDLPAVSDAVDGSSALIAADAGSSMEARRQALVVAQRVMQSLTAAAANQSDNRVLPPSSLGKTFVFDPAQARYVIAPERSGAPAEGVRFILYAVDPTRQQPIVTEEIGFADLVDEGSSTTGAALHFIVISGATTVLDYHVTVDATPEAGTLTVAGFISNGAARLEFQIAAHGEMTSSGAASVVAFRFVVPDRHFVVMAEVRALQSPTRQAQQLNLHVESGAATIALAIASDANSVSANFVVNGQLFATVTGKAAHPDIRSASGRELSPEEMQALGGIMQLASGVFQLFDGLLRPVDAIFALAGVASQ